MKIKKKQKLTKKWFTKLQNIICDNVEQLEKKYGSNKKFKSNKWKHGEFRIIKGEVIEKGGVAFSNVLGKFPKEFAKKILSGRIFFTIIRGDLAGIRWRPLLAVVPITCEKGARASSRF